MSSVDFPEFELYGLPCEDLDCKGVLVDYIDLKTNDFFHRCSECDKVCHRMPAADKLNWAKRVFKRVLKGEKES